MTCRIFVTFGGDKLLSILNLHPVFLEYKIDKQGRISGFSVVLQIVKDGAYF